MFCFNLSPLIINNSTWETGTRNFSLVFLLFNIFLLLKSHESPDYKYAFLLLPAFFVMSSFHRIFYLLFFILLSINVLSRSLYWILSQSQLFYQRKKLIFSANIIIIILILFLQFLFLRNSFIFENTNSSETFYGLYTVYGGSIFNNVLIYIISHSSNVGPILPIVVLGLISFLFGMRNLVKHYFLLLYLIFSLLVSTERTYFPLIIQPSIFILIAFGISKFIKEFNKRIVNYTLSAIVVLTLLLNSLLLVNIDDLDPVTLETYHIQERTFNTALYFQSIKGEDEFFFTNSKEGSKVATINPAFGPEIYSLYYQDYQISSSHNLSRMITDPSFFSSPIHKEYIQYGLELESFRNQRALDYYKINYALLNTRIVSNAVNDCSTDQHLINGCIDIGKLYTDILDSRYSLYKNEKNNIYYL